jgi:hypothetical protein
MEGKAEEMRKSPQGIHADKNYTRWMALFEDQAKRYREEAANIETRFADSTDAEGTDVGDHTEEAASMRAPALEEEATDLEPPYLEPEYASKRRGESPSQPDPALAIARERYARGELSREDFLQLRDDLKTQP